MNKNTFTNFLILTVLAVFLLEIFVLVFIKKNKNCNTERKESTEITINMFQKTQIANIYQNELYEVCNCKLSYKDNVIDLVKLVKDRPILIYRYSLFDCSLCVDFAMNKLKVYFDNLSTNPRIVFIYDDESKRILENTYGKQPYIAQQRKVLGLPLEAKCIPFMFILDSEMKAKQFFIPDKGMPQLTDEYLSIIEQRYFQ